jgi:hypothetical protein
MLRAFIRRNCEREHHDCANHTQLALVENRMLAAAGDRARRRREGSTGGLSDQDDKDHLRFGAGQCRRHQPAHHRRRFEQEVGSAGRDRKPPGCRRRHFSDGRSGGRSGRLHDLRTGLVDIPDDPRQSAQSSSPSAARFHRHRAHGDTTDVDRNQSKARHQQFA